MGSKRGLSFAAIGAAAMGFVGAGCVGDFVNPQFLQSLGAGETAATNPGEAPAIVIEVDNRTSHVLDARLSFRDANNDVQSRPLVIPVGRSIGEAVICPISEITLGEVSDPAAWGAIARLGNGDAADPFIFVEPFGLVLKNEVNYNCGDSITFAVQPSSATLSGFQVFAYIRRGGAN